MVDNEITIEQVHTITPALVDRIRELVQMIGHNYKLLTDDDLKEIVSSSGSTLFIAKDTATNEIAGMITLLVYRIPYVKKALLEDIVVDEKFRGRGIGTLLLHHAIAQAKEKKASYIDIASRPRRTASNSLYKKIGFMQRDTNIYRLVFDYAEA